MSSLVALRHPLPQTDRPPVSASEAMGRIQAVVRGAEAAGEMTPSEASAWLDAAAKALVVAAVAGRLTKRTANLASKCERFATRLNESW